jgi:hypothetical protein
MENYEKKFYMLTGIFLLSLFSKSKFRKIRIAQSAEAKEIELLDSYPSNNIADRSHVLDSHNSDEAFKGEAR